MAQEPIKDDVFYSRENLRIIQLEIDGIRNLLENTKLPSMEDVDFDRKMKTRKELINSLVDWSEKFNSLSGIISFYDYMKEEESKKKGKGLMKGHADTGMRGRARKLIEEQYKKEEE